MRSSTPTRPRASDAARSLSRRIASIPFVVFLIFDFDVTSNTFFYSILSVIVAFLLVGMIKGKIVKKSMIQSGISTIIIGSVAATVAYLVGYGLHFLV